MIHVLGTSTVIATPDDDSFSSLGYTPLLPSACLGTSTVLAALRTAVDAIRTTIIYGYLFGPDFKPRNGITIRIAASIIGPNIETVEHITLSGGSLYTETDSTGLWTFSLIAPSDVIANSQVGVTQISYIIILDDGGIEPVVLPLINFNYSDIPLHISELVDTTKIVSTVPMIGFVGTENGDPVSNVVITAQLSNNGTYIPNTIITVSTDQTVLTQTDSNGFYYLPLIPLSKLQPPGLYYTITEGGTVTKYITVPDAGGFIWNNTLSLISSTGSGISLNLVTADYIENSTFSSILSTDSIIANLSNIRYFMTKIYNESWSTILSGSIAPIITNPALAQSGAVTVTGNVQALAATALRIGNSANIITATINDHAGTGATVNATTSGNAKHGFVSFTTGTADWCPGAMITIDFGQQIITNHAVLQVSPTTVNGYNQMIYHAASTLFTNTGFVLNFAQAPTSSITFEVYYQIDGIQWI